MIDPMDRPTRREAERDAEAEHRCPRGRHYLGEYPDTCPVCAADAEAYERHLEELEA